MYCYAQINEDKICVGISQLSNIIVDESLIAIPSFDTTLIGKKYNEGVWEDVPKPDPEPVPKSDTEKIQDNQLSIMEAMADQYEQQQEVNLNVYDVLATIYETVSGGAE